MVTCQVSHSRALGVRSSTDLFVFTWLLALPVFFTLGPLSMLLRLGRPQNSQGIAGWVFPLSPPHPDLLLPTAVAVSAAPLALSAVGFTAAGITAGSIAAQMMSSAAIANGGGVAAGSLVALSQSVGKCQARQDDGRQSQGRCLPSSPYRPTFLYDLCILVLSLRSFSVKLGCGGCWDGRSGKEPWAKTHATWALNLPSLGVPLCPAM